MLTTEQLNAIKERAEKAQSGPWVHEGNKWHDGYIIYSPVKRGFHNNGGTIAEIDDSYETCDAEFIAHAREDIPTLIAEVERLRKENEELQYAGLKEAMEEAFGGTIALNAERYAEIIRARMGGNADD